MQKISIKWPRKKRNEAEKNVKTMSSSKGKEHEKYNKILEIHSRSKLLEIGLSENGSKYFSADPSLHLCTLFFQTS